MGTEYGNAVVSYDDLLKVCETLLSVSRLDPVYTNKTIMDLLDINTTTLIQKPAPDALCTSGAGLYRLGGLRRPGRAGGRGARPYLTVWSAVGRALLKGAAVIRPYRVACRWAAFWRATSSKSCRSCSVTGSSGGTGRGRSSASRATRVK